MLIDIHTHTYPTSDDSALTPEELINESKRIGLDGICITDHDGFWDPLDIEKLAVKHDFLILPGCEVTTEEGHLLVYGLEKYIFGMHKSKFVKELVDEMDGAIVVAHPYRRVYRETAPQDKFSYDEMVGRALKNHVFKLTDAIEIKNGRGSTSENLFSERLSQELSLPGTGASDAHSLKEVGTYATKFMDPVKNLRDFITALKSGRFRSHKVKYKALD